MKKNINKFIVLLLVIGSFFITGCSTEKKDTTNNSVKEIDFSGTYYNDNSDQMIISKNNNYYKATISLYRLTTLESCDADNIENDILNIKCTDDNARTISFKFDYQSRILTVTETTWSLLNMGDSFKFNK